MPSPTQRIGAQQESNAERKLVRAGYRIVERNWRGAGGEIDRIAWDEDTLVFVEIRARKGRAHGMAMETIGGAKRRHLVRAAAAYLMRFDDVPPVRFDVVSITDDEIELIPDAFDADVAHDFNVPMI